MFTGQTSRLVESLVGLLAQSLLTNPYWQAFSRSYLQLLFKAIDLAIRPNYWDFQYKVKTRLSPKTTLTSLGLGAIDHFELAAPRKSSPEKEYTLRSTPTIDQWNYTVDLALRQLLPDGYLHVALSRTQLDNELDQFKDRSTTDESRRVLLTRSGETENKLRLDVNKSKGRWQYAYGAVGQYVQYDCRFFSRVRREVRDAQGQIVSPQVDVRFQTTIDFTRFGAFGQLTRTLLPDDQLTLSALLGGRKKSPYRHSGQ